jgi:2-dehydropantoate 2-reductase
MALKILVLGAGATGAVFGGRLVEAANADKAAIDVTFLVRAARARALAERGLVFRRATGEVTLPVRSVVTIAADARYDLVLLSCKSYDLDSAMTSIAPAVGPETLVLPLLNGLGHFDQLDQRFGRDRVLGGLCYLAGSLGDDGVITQLGAVERIIYGTRKGNMQTARARLEQLHAAFRQTPVDCRLSDDILQDVWEKYVFLTSLAAMTCLMRASIGDIAATDDGEAIMKRAIAECEAAANAAGHPSRRDVLKQTKAQLTEPGSPATASMLRDLEAGRRIESGHIVGEMLLRARLAGSDATVLQLAWAHLQARDLRLARENPPKT